MDMDSPSLHDIDRQQQQQNTSAHEVSTTVQSSNGQNINATSDLLYNPEQNPEQQLGQDQEISSRLDPCAPRQRGSDLAYLSKLEAGLDASKR